VEGCGKLIKGLISEIADGKRVTRSSNERPGYADGGLISDIAAGPIGANSGIMAGMSIGVGRESPIGLNGGIVVIDTSFV